MAHLTVAAIRAVAAVPALAAGLAGWDPVGRLGRSGVGPRVKSLWEWFLLELPALVTFPAEGHRKDNPAGEAIGAALPKVGHKTTHQKAMAHGEVTAALRKVRSSNAPSSTKLAFEFLVLTACRSREVREAAWDEVDLEAAVWSVPGDRTKTGTEHRVPLSRRAVAVLREAKAFQENHLVFPTATGRTMSDSTLSKLLRELDIAAVTPRLPFDLPRLVWRDDQCAARGRGSGAWPQGR